MPLASFDLLPTIITTFLASHLRGLHRLTVDTRGTGRGLPPYFLTYSLAQRGQDLGPRSVLAPPREIVIDAALGQQVLRAHLPLAPTAVQIQKRIKHLSH